MASPATMPAGLPAPVGPGGAARAARDGAHSRPRGLAAGRLGRDAAVRGHGYATAAPTLHWHNGATELQLMRPSCLGPCGSMSTAAVGSDDVHWQPRPSISAWSHYHLPRHPLSDAVNRGPGGGGAGLGGNSEGSFLSAVLAAKNGDYGAAQRSVERARELLGTELAALVGESYERAYGDMVRVQQVCPT